MHRSMKSRNAHTLWELGILWVGTFRGNNWEVLCGNSISAHSSMQLDGQRVIQGMKEANMNMMRSNNWENEITKFAKYN